MTFTGHADLRLRPNGIRILLSESVWSLDYTDPDSKTTTAPAGLLHDGASVPLFVAFLNGPSIQLAAAHHDLAYRKHTFDDGSPMRRLQADWIMYSITKVCQQRARRGMPTWKRYLLSVTHFIQRVLVLVGLFPVGWIAWKRSYGKPITDDATVDEISAVLTAIAATAAPRISDELL